MVRWNLRDERAVAASESRLDEPAEPALATPILDPDGTSALAAPSTRAARAWVPPDIVAMRSKDRAEAHRWRLALRESFGDAIGAGFSARGMTRDGWYLLYR